MRLLRRSGRCRSGCNRHGAFFLFFLPVFPLVFKNVESRASRGFQRFWNDKKAVVNDKTAVDRRRNGGEKRQKSGAIHRLNELLWQTPGYCGEVFSRHNNPVLATVLPSSTAMESVPVAERERAKNGLDQSVNELNVNMSNALVRAAHGLTLAEKRVVSICIAKMDSVGLNNGRYKFKLTAREFAETFEVDANTAYEQLQFAGNHLIKRIARTFEDGRRGKIEHKWVWVSGVAYHPGEGWMELGFSPEMTPHLTLLRQQFTSRVVPGAKSLIS